MANSSSSDKVIMEHDNSIMPSPSLFQGAMAFTIGTAVVLQGLTNRKDLNNKHGKIIAERNEGGRFGVQVGAERIRVLENNLVTAESKLTNVRNALLGMQARRDAEASTDAPFGMAYECPRCKAHRVLGYRCCGFYVGTGLYASDPVPRRNVHEHPEADEQEVADFLEASIFNSQKPR